MTGDKPFKLVILISGSGSNLQALIDAIACGQLDVQIVGVISNRSSAEGLVRAKCSNIPTRIIDHNHFDDRNKYDNRLAETVKSYSPDLVVLAGFMRILGPRFVDRFIGRLINIHSNTAQIGRMAVIKEWRRHNIGTKLLHELENHAKTQGFTHLILHAQVYVQKFYQGNGYTATGDIFLDENIPHILMEKKLT